MKIYIAGPMRGIKDFNFPAFFAAADKLRKDGHVVFNPAEKDHAIHGKGFEKSKTGSLKTIEKRGFSLRRALRDDTRWICTHADAVALLPGWSKSKGACAERALARALGLKLIYIKE